MQLLIRPEAETDLVKIHVWYQKQREGLGNDFKLCLDALFEKIKRNPKICPVVYQNIRRGFIKHFPFGVLYILEPKKIVVLAILHARRDPKTWQNRL